MGHKCSLRRWQVRLERDRMNREGGEKKMLRHSFREKNGKSRQVLWPDFACISHSQAYTCLAPLVFLPQITQIIFARNALLLTKEIQKALSANCFLQMPFINCRTGVLCYQ
jgi:hypothetical protein